MNDSTLTAHEALQMAREANAIAKQLNEETKEQITATRNMHDEMLLNQRRISFALCKLLPKQIADNIVLSNGSVIGFVDTGSSADDLVGMDNSIALAMKNRDVFDIVHAINVLAMANTDVIQVIACFSGNINEFFVNAFDAPDDRSEYVEIFRKSVTLSDEDALAELLAIESQLTELIIDARDTAEAQGEVNA